MNIYEDTYLPDILHDIAQGLLTPTMVLIVALILVSLFFLGCVLVEYFTERRGYKQNIPQIINQINDAPCNQLVEVIAESKLLRFQKAPLICVVRNMGLPEEQLFALAQTEIAKAEKHYKHRLAWTDTLSKIAPLLGLMGTLIPLGPGIVALGQKDVTELSNALLLAFDATVCGLVCAILALVVSKIRSLWYTEYIATLESLMSCVLDKAASAKEAGEHLPSGFSGDVYKELKAAAKSTKGSKSAKAGNAQGEVQPVRAVKEA